MFTSKFKINYITESFINLDIFEHCIYKNFTVKLITIIGRKLFIIIIIIIMVTL